MLPDIQPGNTKILYFFNCLLDGMHTNFLWGFVCLLTPANSYFLFIASCSLANSSCKVIESHFTLCSVSIAFRLIFGIFCLRIAFKNWSSFCPVNPANTSIGSLKEGFSSEFSERRYGSISSFFQKASVPIGTSY